MISFEDFDEILVPLARKLGLSVSNDQPPGQPNRYWGILCGTRETIFHPSISMVNGWETAVLHRSINSKPEWLHDLREAIQIMVKGLENQ